MVTSVSPSIYQLFLIGVSGGIGVYPSSVDSVTGRNTPRTSHKSVTGHTPFTHTLPLIESPVNLMCMYLLCGTKHKLERYLQNHWIDCSQVAANSCFNTITVCEFQMVTRDKSSYVWLHISFTLLSLEELFNGALLDH